MNLWYDPEQQVIVDKNERRKHYAYTHWLCILPVLLIPDNEFIWGGAYVV